MKKIRIISLILTLIISLTFYIGCNNSTNGINNQTKSTLDQIVEKKEMKVGYLVFSPCVIKNQQTGELSGIFVDMVNQIAEALKVKTVWVETNLANFSAGLNSGQFDFCVGPTFINITRSTSVAFTQPVNYVGNSGVVLKNGKFKPNTVEDLNKEGIRIAVLQGQVMEEFSKRNFPKAQIISMAGSDLTAPLLAVSSNNADIGFMNNVTIMSYAKEHQEVEPVFVEANQLENLPLSWTTKFSDSSLLMFLNSSITYFKSTGRLADFQKKYDIKLLYDIPNLEMTK